MLADTGQTIEQRKAYILALMYERKGYIARNLPDRVKAVEDELQRVGAKAQLAEIKVENAKASLAARKVGKPA